MFQFVHLANKRLFGLSDARERSLEVAEEFVLRLYGKEFVARTRLLETLLGDFAVGIAVLVKDFGC